MIICGNCNTKFRRHCQWNGDIKTPVWVCQKKQISKNKNCNMLPIKESVLKQAFVESMKRLYLERDKFTGILKENIESCLKEDNNTRIKELEDITETKSIEMLELNKQYRNKEISKEDYMVKFDLISAELDKLIAEKERLQSSIQQQNYDTERMKQMQEYLNNPVLFDEFNPDLLTDLVETIRVMDKHNIIFEFKCGFIYKMRV